MKKFKIGPSFIFLILLCALTGKSVLIINYILALSLHEMAHLLVATKNGYSLKLIKLDMFGLSVELNETIDEKDNFKINVAGPAFNLLLCIVCMAFYWLIPVSYLYLNIFCFCNLTLAIFNLLPVYPLDGGKIFRGLIKSDKLYKILDCLIRYSLATLFICAFFVSCFQTVNFMLLLLALFFITSKGKKTPTLSIFKFRQNKSFDKVVILKAEETEILFNLIKQIKSNHYTIFYVPKLNKYFDEDNIVNLSLNNSLTSQIRDVEIDSNIDKGKTI